MRHIPYDPFEIVQRDDTPCSWMAITVLNNWILYMYDNPFRSALFSLLSHQRLCEDAVDSNRSDRYKNQTYGGLREDIQEAVKRSGQTPEQVQRAAQAYERERLHPDTMERAYCTILAVCLPIYAEMRKMGYNPKDLW